jgi:hypothetical protein
MSSEKESRKAQQDPKPKTRPGPCHYCGALPLPPIDEIACLPGKKHDFEYQA